MSVLTLALGALATWRVSHLIVYENGPFHVFRRIRMALGVTYLPDSDEIASYKYELVVCMWCMSVWVGAGVTVLIWLLPILAPWLFVPFALSAVAMMIQQAVP